MALSAVLMIGLKASIGLVVFGIGLQATTRDLRALLQRPGLLARTILSMNVVMPLLATGIVTTFGLPPAVNVGLVALAMSPLPPLLPGRATKSGGTPSYAIGLFVVASIVAIVSVPVTMWLLSRHSAISYKTPERELIVLIVVSVLAPLFAGVVVRRVAPSFADRMAKPVERLAPLLLIAAVIPLLVSLWPTMQTLLRDGAVMALAGFAIAGLAIGHELGGPVPQDRAVLALATVSRHPAAALTIAAANFSDKKTVIASVLLAVIVNALVSTPYAMWSKRRRAPLSGATDV